MQQNFKVNQDKSNNPLKIGTAQKKLLFVFCYYVVLSIVALTTFTVFTRDTPLLLNAVQRYFFCEQSGHNSSNPCDLGKFEKLTSTEGITLAFVLLMMFSMVNLIYIVSIEEIKNLSTSRFVKKKSFNSNSRSIENSSKFTAH